MYSEENISRIGNEKVTEETKKLKEEVKAIVKETEEGRRQLNEAVERLAAQLDECAKSQVGLKKSIQELKELVSL